MRTIVRPLNEVSQVFLTCVQNTRNKYLKKKLTNTLPQLKQSQKEFDIKAGSNKLHKIKPVTKFHSGLMPEQMVKVYTNRMARKKSPGRMFYDVILSMAPQGLCPYCCQIRASTLDHYLDKASYPQFSVTPINLIPACKDCNHNKAAYSKPQDTSTEIINPYYDNVDQDSWLIATIIKSNAPVVEYSVSPPANWNVKLKTKLQRHFEVMDLKKMYGTHAASDLSGLRKNLLKVESAGGMIGVKEYLSDLADSRRATHLNSWQTALYTGAAASDWFCSTGFKLF